MLPLKEIRHIYGKRAKWYDLTANLYYLVGFREQAYRRAAVRALGLHEGDTVVELCCGTGLNFGLLEQAIGPQGKLIGVDMTPEMLAQALRRVERRGWQNVELVQSRASEYEFPSSIDGVISTCALTLEPKYDGVIGRAAAALAPGGRVVVLDFRLPERWPRWLVSAFVALTRPFGVTRDLGERHPWESIARYLGNYQFRSFYWGLAYVAAGTRVGGPWGKRLAMAAAGGKEAR
jgi:ubiquinone/menaquinone biosynthesis C-methylase UbiE